MIFAEVLVFLGVVPSRLISGNLLRIGFNLNYIQFLFSPLDSKQNRVAKQFCYAKGIDFSQLNLLIFVSPCFCGGLFAIAQLWSCRFKSFLSPRYKKLDGISGASYRCLSQKNLLNF